MKKLIVLLIAAILIPLGVKAETQVLDFKDTLESENIELAYPEYTENENQVTIYLFRGQGCTHCEDFLEFLNSIAEEYGDKFKLRSYEVYYNSDNSAIKDSVVDFFDIDASGVPLIVIGENTFYGFDEEYEEKILKSIDKEYEADERYDVFEKMQEEKDAKNPNDALYILIPIIGVVVIVYIVKLSKKEA